MTFTLTIAVCIISTGQCQSFPHHKTYQSITECDKGAEEIISSIRDLLETGGTPGIVARVGGYTCALQE